MALKRPDPVYTFKKNMAQINCLFLCSESEFLYVGTSRGLVHIWDLKTKREIKNIKVCDNDCLAIVRWQEMFVIQERGVGLKFWKVECLEWHLLQIIKTDYYGFCRIVVCEQYKQIFIPNDNGVITSFHNCNETVTICDKIEDKRNKTGEVMCMKYLRYCNGLLVALECGMLALWIFEESLPKIGFKGKFNDETPMCLDVCELTREGVLGTTGYQLKKFSVENNIIETRSTRLTNPGISCITLSKEGKLVAAGCWDGRIRYFSMKHLTLLAVLDFHSEGSVQHVIFVEDELSTCAKGTLFAAGCDGRVSIWELYTNRGKK